LMYNPYIQYIPQSYQMPLQIQVPVPVAIQPTPQFVQMSNPNQNPNYYPQMYEQNMNMNMNMGMNIPPQNSYSNFYLDRDMDANSCTYCEEIYKFTIMNNLPLKLMTCLYCNKVMNGNSLEFYLRKYKSELEDLYKRKLNDNKNTCEHEYSITTTTNHFEIKSQDQNDKVNYHKISPKSKDDFDITHRIKSDTKETEPYLTISYEGNKFDRGKSADNNYIEHKLKDRYKDESSNMVLDTTDTGMSLAEVFKRRRANLLNKMDVRASSVKESKNKSTTDVSESENLEMKNINKIKKKKDNVLAPKINLDLNSITEENKVIKGQHKNLKSEPSPEVMNRLINGERANVCKYNNY
jgi:hypothetical protein